MTMPDALLQAACKHELIITWRIEETGESAGLWSCADCNHKFVPMDAESSRALEEAPQPLRMLTKEECATVTDMTAHDTYADYANVQKKFMEVNGLALEEAQEDGGPLRDGWHIMIGPGHAGYGAYAVMTEYPDEGSVCLATFDPKEYPDASVCGLEEAQEGREASLQTAIEEALASLDAGMAQGAADTLREALAAPCARECRRPNCGCNWWEQCSVGVLGTAPADHLPAAKGATLPSVPALVPAGQVVAWMWQHEETGRVGFIDQWQIDNGWQAANPRLRLIRPLVFADAAVLDTQREEGNER